MDPETSPRGDVSSIALGIYLRAVEAAFDWFLLGLFTRIGVRYP
jgi:hypothetical protein